MGEEIGCVAVKRALFSLVLPKKKEKWKNPSQTSNDFLNSNGETNVCRCITGIIYSAFSGDRRSNKEPVVADHPRKQEKEEKGNRLNSSDRCHPTVVFPPPYKHLSRFLASSLSVITPVHLVLDPSEILSD